MSRETGVVWFLRTSEQELEGIRVVAVEGRVSHATAAELGRVLARPHANGLRGVVVDLSGADYINGAGLQVFERAAARLRDANLELVVCGLQPAVQAAFSLGGAVPNLAIETSRDSALRRCGEPRR
jgi:anti-anti-sigma factor